MSAYAVFTRTKTIDREQILNLTFGVVIFSTLVQGLTIKPLLNLLKLAKGDNTTSA
jgi:NhaP-type Na+/H+ or K+/H+ antiporter